MTRRVSRRAFLAGAGGAAVVAATGGTAAVIAIRSGSSKPQTAPATESPTSIPAATPTPTATPIARGGIARITSATSFNIDTFDSQLSGSTALNEVLGRTHSRLLNWDTTGLLALKGDLATGWEQPDDQTLLFHLDSAARWHDRKPLNGRALTAEDVVSHFRRSLETAAAGKAPLAQRYDEYATIASVDSPAPGSVRFRLNQPDPDLLGTLAGEYALIQAPEAVAAFSGSWSKLDSDHVIGTGPWTFEWADDGAKFTASRAGHRQPLLDELVVSEPRRDTAQRFIDGTLDEVLVRDRRDAEAIRAKFPIGAETVPRDVGLAHALKGGAVFLRGRSEREIVTSSFFIGSAPWNNPDLITAISIALTRPTLAKMLFGGRASPSLPSPPAFLTQIEYETLMGRTGYSPEFPEGPTGGARTLWEAAGGPGLGTITVDFPSVFDPLYSASSVVIEMLNEALGPQFRPAVETYTTISKRVVEGYYGNGRAAFWFGWGGPLASPDRKRYLRDMYAPGSPGQRAVGGPGFDLSTDSEGLIPLGFLGIVPWVQQYAEVFRRPTLIAPPRTRSGTSTSTTSEPSSLSCWWLRRALPSGASRGHRGPPRARQQGTACGSPGWR